MSVRRASLLFSVHSLATASAASNTTTASATSVTTSSTATAPTSTTTPSATRSPPCRRPRSSSYTAPPPQPLVSYHKPFCMACHAVSSPDDRNASTSSCPRVTSISRVYLSRPTFNQQAHHHNPTRLNLSNASLTQNIDLGLDINGGFSLGDITASVSNVLHQSNDNPNILPAKGASDTVIKFAHQMSSEPAPHQTTADKTTNNPSMANNTNPTSNNIPTSDNSTKSTTSSTSHTSSSSSTSTSTTTRHQNQPSSQPHHYAFRSGVAFEPHPQKREKGGEDAYFLHDQALGVFDGVGGWSNVGVDAGLYSKELARLTSQHLERTGPSGVVEALKVATVLNRSVGSSTACVVGLDGDRLVGVNLGDSGLIVIRGNEIVYRTSEQQHYFNCPFQIGTDSLDTVDVGAPVDFVLKPGDCVVMGTDGLWDNVFKYDIVDIVMEHDIASDFVQHNEQSLSNKCTTTMTTSTTNPSHGVKVNPAAIDRTSTSSSNEEQDVSTLDPMVKCNDHKPECNDSDESEKTDSEFRPSGESTGADGDTDTETDEPSSSSSSSSSLSSSTSSGSTIASPRQQESDEACCSDDDQAMSVSVNGAAGTGSDQDGASSVLSDCEAEADASTTAVVRKAQRIADVLAQTAIKVANDERVLSPFAVNAREAGHLFLGGKVDDITIVVAIVCPYSMDYTLRSEQNGRTVGMMDVDGHDSNSANGGMKSGGNKSSKKTKILALSTTESEAPANMTVCGSSPSALALPTSDDSSDDDDSDDDDITHQGEDGNDDDNQSDNIESVDASNSSVEVIHAVKNSGKGTPRDKSPRSILDQGDASVLTGDSDIDNEGHHVTDSSDSSCIGMDENEGRA